MPFCTRLNLGQRPSQIREVVSRGISEEIDQQLKLSNQLGVETVEDVEDVEMPESA